MKIATISAGRGSDEDNDEMEEDVKLTRGEDSNKSLQRRIRKQCMLCSRSRSGLRYQFSLVLVVRLHKFVGMFYYCGWITHCWYLGVGFLHCWGQNLEKNLRRIQAVVHFF
ncbi:hypothetical protein L195_g040436 [Trifolium pratense]|uniref:Uncharacterized protein n=1 Tax=Trifolium pratense TaxID=57577 RepID=A0A2K3M0R4_TRIPR|nr:hypothetical protein L195_g040436 [Trifolium pratense]